MTRTRTTWLTLAASVGLAHWFFGNLYEAVVISPNWVVDSPAQMQRLNEFFARTSPTLYFVTVPTVAILLTWALAFVNRDDDVRRGYRRAAVCAALSMALNGYIVATVIPHLFGPGYLAHADELADYCRRWNILNVARMALVATTAVQLFGVFRTLDRHRPDPLCRSTPALAIS